MFNPIQGHWLVVLKAVILCCMLTDHSQNGTPNVPFFGTLGVPFFNVPLLKHSPKIMATDGLETMTFVLAVVHIIH